MTRLRPPLHVAGRFLLLAAAASGLLAGPTRAQAPPSAPAAAASAPMPAPTPKSVRKGVPVRPVPSGVASATKDGNKALLEQRPDDALALYSKAQVGAPEMPEIEYNRGLAALLAGDPAEAARAFETTRDLAKPKPQSEPVSDALLDDSRFNGAHADWAQERLAEAIQGWASVVAKDPGATDARRNLEMALRLVQRDQQQQQQQQEDQQKEEPKPEDQEKQEQEQDGQGEQPPPPQPQDQPKDQPPEKDPREEQAPSPGEMTKDQAEDLLEALEATEKQDMKEKRDKQARRVVDAGGKDW